MIVWIGLAGGLGAVCRYLVDGWLGRLRPRRFPLGTLVINATGSFVLGFAHGWWPGGVVLAVIGTGFCGGFTTFSTASVEAVRLRQAEGWRAGLGYAALVLALCVACAGTGFWLGTM